VNEPAEQTGPEAPPEIEPFKAQVARVRPHQFETPDSYLARLCAANVIDPSYIARQTEVRRQRTRRRNELAHVIAELGGPPVGHFPSEYARAFVKESPSLAEVFGPRRSVRQACRRCTAGEEVETFDQRRFMMCLKHDRWVGPGDQRQIIDYEMRNVERRFRRLTATGLIPPFAHDAVVNLVDRHATVLGDRLWRGHRQHAHAPIDHYPALVHILQVLADYLSEHWPLECEIRTWHRRPEQRRLYDHLRTRLTWLGERTVIWKLTNELVGVAIDIITSRTVEFAFDIDELGQAADLAARSLRERVG
jgi:hypothetical protein